MYFNFAVKIQQQLVNSHSFQLSYARNIAILKPTPAKQLAENATCANKSHLDVNVIEVMSICNYLVEFEIFKPIFVEKRQTTIKFTSLRKNYDFISEIVTRETAD